MNIQHITAAGIEIVGDINYRGLCDMEDAETITLISQIRKAYGGRFELAALHVENEKKREGDDFRKLEKSRKKGAIITGWSDVCVTGWPTLFIEMKRRDHTLSKCPQVEIDFLVAQQANDCWCCVALGWRAGFTFFEKWYQANYIDTAPLF